VQLGSGPGLPLWRQKLIFITFRLENASVGISDQSHSVNSLGVIATSSLAVFFERCSADAC
jgi:hypothetical protein